MLSESEQTRLMSQTQPGSLFSPSCGCSGEIRAGCPVLRPRHPAGINRPAALRRREGDSHWGHTSQEVHGVPGSQEGRVKGSQEGLDRELDIINSYAGAELYHCKVVPSISDKSRAHVSWHNAGGLI